MLVSFQDRKINFHIDAPASKSIYHRELIVRFLLGDTSHLAVLDNDNEDVRATKACLSALHHAYSDEQITEVHLPCNESGSTLRFMIPVAGAFLLQKENHYRLIFETRGRLFDRPIKELSDALEPHGIQIVKNETDRTIEVTGQMTAGEYIIGGNVSSQYISGLLMGLSIFPEPCSVMVLGEVKSVHYIELTQEVLSKYGAPAVLSENIYTTTPIREPISESTGNLPVQTLKMLGELNVEGDWSNGAFLLCLSQFTDITVGNLNPESKQGDIAILDFIQSVKEARGKLEAMSNAFLPTVLSEDSMWDCDDIPDIAPYMAITSAFFYHRATFSGIKRLRIKESDRVAAIRSQLSAIGIKTEETENTLTVYGSPIDSIQASIRTPIQLTTFHDHRMAMCTLLIGAALKTEIEVDDLDCLNKSFPELLRLIEKYLR